MFIITKWRANRMLSKLDLSFKYKIRKTKDESWSSHNCKFVYLNPDDRKCSMMAEESELHILLHELGHIFVEKHKKIKKDPNVIKLFGDMRKFYRRDLSRKHENPDFISHYSQVHPEDNFVEVFAVYTKNEGNMKKIRKLLTKKHKNQKVLKQFIWLDKFIKSLK